MLKAALKAAIRLRAKANSKRYDLTESATSHFQATPAQLGVNIERDTQFLLSGRAEIIFDVGANVGQSISVYRRLFPESQIHSFEPNEGAFEAASLVGAQYNNVVVNNIALADYVGDSVFYEYERSDMSSWLKPAVGQLGWSELRKETKVRTTTIDSYCREHEIEAIDVLKIDTQGTDDAVLRGAEGMLTHERIKLVRSELIFMKLYEGQFDPLQSIAWMQARGYQVVSFYDQYHKENALGWLDILYRHQSLEPPSEE